MPRLISVLLFAPLLMGMADPGRMPQGGTPICAEVPSPNFSERQSFVSAIIIHHTVMGGSALDVAHYFAKPEPEVSSHYVIDKEGVVVRCVPEALKAWHAGVSQLEGREGVNAFSIGIELVNRGDGKDPFTYPQMVACARLVRDLMQRYGVPASRVVGHRDVALPKGRKVDPADNFSYAKLVKLMQEIPEPARALR